METTITNAKIHERTVDQSDRSRARAYREYDQKPRVYIWPASESILSNLQNRKSRPIALFRNIAKKALADNGIEAGRMRWSQYAGCTMCPCSPGFVLEEFSGVANRRFDLHVHFKEAE